MNCPKCGIEIESHPSGICLDTLCVSFVMKWRYWWPDKKFTPSTNIVHAMRGEDKIPKSDWVKYCGILENVIRYDKKKGHVYMFELIHATAYQRTRALILWALEKNNTYKKGDKK